MSLIYDLKNRQYTLSPLKVALCFIIYESCRSSHKELTSMVNAFVIEQIQVSHNYQKKLGDLKEKPLNVLKNELAAYLRSKVDSTPISLKRVPTLFKNVTSNSLSA